MQVYCKASTLLYLKYRISFFGQDVTPVKTEEHHHLQNPLGLGGGHPEQDDYGDGAGGGPGDGAAADGGVDYGEEDYGDYGEEDAEAFDYGEGHDMPPGGGGGGGEARRTRPRVSTLSYLPLIGQLLLGGFPEKRFFHEVLCSLKQAKMPFNQYFTKCLKKSELPPAFDCPLNRL